ncbi:hypothetical protein DYST_02921 [Dyella terrae]|nr:hypothetical protein DYST_02921 [Dyella terrae]
MSLSGERSLRSLRDGGDFDGYVFPRTICPGQTQLFDLTPDFGTKDFAAAIAYQKPSERWECSSVSGVRSDGRRIKLTNYVPPPPMPWFFGWLGLLQNVRFRPVADLGESEDCYRYGLI